MMPYELINHTGRVWGFTAARIPATAGDA
jgi:hypothetical protein